MYLLKRAYSFIDDRNFHMDLTVEAAGTKQRPVQDSGPLVAGKENDTVVRGKPFHFSQSNQIEGASLSRSMAPVMAFFPLLVPSIHISQ
jgi:hypothetical protein